MHNQLQKPSDIRVVNAFSLLVHAQSATVDCKSECEFSLSLYDSTDQKFISLVIKIT